MDNPNQSPLVYPSSCLQPPFPFQFQFMEECKEEEDADDDEEEEEVDNERLEVRERKPAFIPLAPATPVNPFSVSLHPTPTGPGYLRRACPVVDLIYWRDVKKTGVIFGVSLSLLLSFTVFSVVSVVAFITMFLLSSTICCRICTGIIQAIQNSHEGHLFRAYLDKEVAISEELVQKYSKVVHGHFNSLVKELMHLFLVNDLVDSLIFAVLLRVFIFVGTLFNGLTLLILALISLFSIPVIYEKPQTLWLLFRGTRLKLTVIIALVVFKLGWSLG